MLCVRLQGEFMFCYMVNNLYFANLSEPLTTRQELLTTRQEQDELNANMS